MNDCQIERETGIPRRTICDWRRSPARRAPYVKVRGLRRRTASVSRAASYAYLLGAYLGDGHIVLTRRGVYRLRVACDLLHLNIAWWIALAIEDVRGRRAALQPRMHSRALDVSSYWKHWPCLFPQHGPGRKHERRIALVPWQQRIVDAHPDQLVRGLIHSDGSRHINRIKHPKRTYDYVDTSSAIARTTSSASSVRRAMRSACSGGS